MSEEPIARNTGSDNFQRVYMTPDESAEADHTPEGAIKEGRVRTEEENFRDQHKIKVEDKLQEEEILLAGKYKSAEELERAYKELESKLGSKEPEQKEEAEKIAEAVENLPADLFSKGAEEFSQTGQLSEDTVKELVKKGIPEEYINQYLEGINAQTSLMVMTINEKLGGEKHVQEIVDWAENNLTDAEIESYNDLIDSGDLDRIVTAYKSIEARMGATTGKRFISPTDGTSTESGGFQSKSEMVQAMTDPRYAKDPAFRAQVEKRLARSRF